MRAWLTPEAAAGDYVCRRFSIPVELLHVVTGALETLTHASSFEAHGSMTPAEAAALMLEMFNSYQTSEGDCLMELLGQIVWLTYHPGALAYYEYYKLCDGSAFAKADYPEYWAALVESGYEYVWEYDADMFRVPDLIGRFIQGTNDEPGGTGGEATHSLTTAEMPAHTHTEGVTGATGLFVAPGEVPAVIAGGAGVTGSTGGGDAHNNLPPFMVLAPYIRLKR